MVPETAVACDFASAPKVLAGSRGRQRVAFQVEEQVMGMRCGQEHETASRFHRQQRVLRRSGFPFPPLEPGRAHQRLEGRWPNPGIDASSGCSARACRVVIPAGRSFRIWSVRMPATNAKWSAVRHSSVQRGSQGHRLQAATGSGADGRGHVATASAAVRRKRRR